VREKPDKSRTEPGVYSLSVTDSDIDGRVDHFLRDKLKNVSRTYVQKLLSSGHITVNGCEVRGSYRPKEGDEIEVVIPEAQEFHLSPEPIPLNVVYEDSDLIVIDKPAGLVVHPAPGHWTGTLVNALLYHVRDFKGIAGQIRPGLIHRLDMNTSGLMVVAKSDSSLAFLSEEMKHRRIKRLYRALTWGHFNNDRGTIRAPIGRSIKDRKRMAVTDKNSRPAITNYNVLVRYAFADSLELSLQTGRTHQIRVHLSHSGHPVIGDPDYGGREKAVSGLFDRHRPAAREVLQSIDRQALHAYKLAFKHPYSGLMLSFESAIPDDMQLAAKVLSEAN
jgi:23S rRNA pseudouridine1911/1915/1917 synthase